MVQSCNTGSFLKVTQAATVPLFQMAYGLESNSLYDIQSSSGGQSAVCADCWVRWLAQRPE